MCDPRAFHAARCVGPIRACSEKVGFRLHIAAAHAVDFFKKDFFLPLDKKSRNSDLLKKKHLNFDFLRCKAKKTYKGAKEGAEGALGRFNELGMDALVTVLRTRPELRIGHGCFSHLDLFWNVWAWMLSVTVFTRNMNGIRVWHGCSSLVTIFAAIAPQHCQKNPRTSLKQSLRKHTCKATQQQHVCLGFRVSALGFRV